MKTNVLKLIAAILAILMISVAFVACGDNTGSGAVDETTADTATDSVTTDTETQTETETEADQAQKGIDHGEAMADADIPVIGWDETASAE